MRRNRGHQDPTISLTNVARSDEGGVVECQHRKIAAWIEDGGAGAAGEGGGVVQHEVWADVETDDTAVGLSQFAGA